ncbi:MAG: YigZ family protein [Paludibacter sp. 47-17]|nr:MAG: YigZ family protein [Paludibacter sp. SCN 50-10]OJX91911.1 MAG: YigZ family protein [Paludibacter sp. 47-17]
MAERIGFYRTLSRPGEGLYREKGSKFIAMACPVGSVEEVRDVLASVRKKYYDARHVCYAYMLGAERTEFRANDDGEPSGTAGRPILGQINSRHLTDVLVIVVRYFGGVLLGTGGLIVAYKEAAAEALDAAGMVERQVELALTICFGYAQMNEVMKRIRDHQARIIAQEIKMECTLQVLVGLEASEIMINQLEKTEGVTVDY